MGSTGSTLDRSPVRTIPLGRRRAVSVWPRFGGAQPKRGQTDTAGILPSGIVRNGDLSKVEPVDPMKITEDVARGWYSYREGDGTPLRPCDGETTANYTGPNL